LTNRDARRGLKEVVEPAFNEKISFDGSDTPVLPVLRIPPNIQISFKKGEAE
jgi:hypothetical protein